MSRRPVSKAADSESGVDRRHYSYSAYADPDMARTFDDRRFGGPIGELVARSQAQVILEGLGDLRQQRVLDVGTGTGRAALLLARAGAQVTGVDASSEMLAVARQRAAETGGLLTFQEMDAHALGFPDRAFHVGVSLRVLMHTPRWDACIRELCRVSSHIVVLDYPSAHSFARVQALARRALHGLGVRTEAYRVFSDRQIADALTAGGFTIRSRHRQFVLPIALHKTIGSLGFTRASEGTLARLGLLARYGSPVTVIAERCESS